MRKHAEQIAQQKALLKMKKVRKRSEAGKLPSLNYPVSSPMGAGPPQKLPSSIVEFGIKISFPNMDDLKPQFQTPYDYIIDNETRIKLDVYERFLFRYQELVHSDFGIQDLIEKYYGSLNIEGFTKLSNLHFELSSHLDQLFTIFTNYTMHVSYTLTALKFMNYVTFIRFTDDLEIGRKLASYIFLISSRPAKELDKKIAGETFEE